MYEKVLFMSKNKIESNIFGVFTYLGQNPNSSIVYLESDKVRKLNSYTITTQYGKGGTNVQMGGYLDKEIKPSYYINFGNIYKIIDCIN